MPKMRVTTLGIGHGDAVLIQAEDHDGQWTCLIDGGSSAEQLDKRLNEMQVQDIDLLILSHLDTDHVGGILALAQKRRIECYWGPALPAFERHLWLFGARGEDALRRGRDLETSLQASGTAILYPLEGYASAPMRDMVKISVLSPTGRLIRRLLTDEDVPALFTTQPMPLGWLLNPAPPPIEQSQALDNLDAALARFALIPQNIATLPPVGAQPTDLREELQESWAQTTGLSTEYFGDSVLNNTSVVIYMEVRTGLKVHRLLFPGDQENWTYLLARHPKGLQTDVLKACHHGGRVYIEANEAYDEFFSAVRPRAVLISANGRHNLPRDMLRQSALRWGATVFCTSRRAIEHIAGATIDHVCCHNTHRCSSDTHNVTLVFDEDGIRSQTSACHSGMGHQAVPVIQMRQHIIEPSPILNQLFEHELLRHIAWVRAKLTDIHKNRRGSAVASGEGSRPIGEDVLATLARAEKRATLVPHLRNVLEQGMHRGEFWAVPSESYSRSSWHAYAMPTVQENQVLLMTLRQKLVLYFRYRDDQLPRDCDSLVNGMDLSGLSCFAETTMQVPACAFRDTLWPTLAHELKSGWRCYQGKWRSKPGIAFSQYGEVRQFLYHLAQECLYKSSSGEFMCSLTSPRDSVLLSGQDTEAGLEGLRGFLLNHSKQDSSLYGERVRLTDEECDEVVGMVAHNVRQLW